MRTDLNVGQVDVRIEEIGIDGIAHKVFNLFLGGVKDVDVQRRLVGHTVVHFAPDQLADVDLSWPDVLPVDQVNDLDGFVGIVGPLPFQSFACKPKLKRKRNRNLQFYRRFIHLKLLVNLLLINESSSPVRGTFRRVQRRQDRREGSADSRPNEDKAVFRLRAETLTPNPQQLRTFKINHKMFNIVQTTSR